MTCPFMDNVARPLSPGKVIWFLKGFVVSLGAEKGEKDRDQLVRKEVLISPPRKCHSQNYLTGAALCAEPICSKLVKGRRRSLRPLEWLPWLSPKKSLPSSYPGLRFAQRRSSSFASFIPALRGLQLLSVLIAPPVRVHSPSRQNAVAYGLIPRAAGRGARGNPVRIRENSSDDPPLRLSGGHPLQCAGCGVLRYPTREDSDYRASLPWCNRRERPAPGAGD
jgi:hypothetical protein